MVLQYQAREALLLYRDDTSSDRYATNIQDADQYATDFQDYQDGYNGYGTDIQVANGYGADISDRYLTDIQDADRYWTDIQDHPSAKVLRDQGWTGEGNEGAIGGVWGGCGEEGGEREVEGGGGALLMPDSGLMQIQGHTSHTPSSPQPHHTQTHRSNDLVLVTNSDQSLLGERIGYVGGGRGQQNHALGREPWSELH